MATMAIMPTMATIPTTTTAAGIATLQLIGSDPEALLISGPSSEDDLNSLCAVSDNKEENI